MNSTAIEDENTLILPEEVGLKLENILLKEQILEQKQIFLQKEIDELKSLKKRYITQLQQELGLPQNFEVDLSSRCVRVLHSKKNENE